MSGVKAFQSDGFYLDYDTSTALAAGDVVVVGDKVGVADNPFEANTLASLSIHGVYTVPKESGGGVTFAADAAVYWDNTAKLAVATDGAGANKQMGTAIFADSQRGGADADDYVRVLLRG